MTTTTTTRKIRVPRHPHPCHRRRGNNGCYYSRRRYNGFEKHCWACTSMVLVWLVALLSSSPSSLLLFAHALNNKPNLPFGDINVVVLTDTHSWIAGHGFHEQEDGGNNADYGDVLSFVQQLQKYFLLNEENDDVGDLWFVMNGDWIDGTGLAMNGDPSELIPLLEKMPFDAINVGNHELYRSPVVQYASRPGGFIDSWGDKYVSSNVLHSTGSKEPLAGRRYTVLRGKRATVLTFGFLYNMINHCPEVMVEKVESVVQESWFTEALKSENYDAVLVMAHMHVADPLVDVILTKIRRVLGDKMPVQFVTGHTHIRSYNRTDANSASFEAGKFLDTVGFVSFPTKATAAAAAAAAAAQGSSGGGATTSGIGGGGTSGGGSGSVGSGGGRERRRRKLDEEDQNSTGSAIGSGSANAATPPSNDNTTSTPTAAETETTTEGSPPINDNDNDNDNLFQYAYLDPNIDHLRTILDVDDMSTADGVALSKFIARTRERMGLEDVISCVERAYYLNASLDRADSLWGLFQKYVVPTSRLSRNNPRSVVFLHKGGLRYDLAEGRVRVDDVIAVSPFNDTLVKLEAIPASVLVKLNATMNNVTAAGGGGGMWLPPDPFDALPEYIWTPTDDSFDAKSPAGTYDLITENFVLPKIKEALEGIDPGAANGTAVDTGETTTSVWLEYFRAHASADASSCGKNKRNKGGNAWGSGGGAGGNSDAGDYGSGDDGSISTLGLAIYLLIIAAVVVMSLIAFLFNNRTTNRFAANDKQRLNNIDDDDYDDDDHDNDGNFVNHEHGQQQASYNDHHHDDGGHDEEPIRSSNHEII